MESIQRIKDNISSFVSKDNRIISFTPSFVYDHELPIEVKSTINHMPALRAKGQGTFYNTVISIFFIHQHDIPGVIFIFLISLHSTPELAIRTQSENATPGTAIL